MTEWRYPSVCVNLDATVNALEKAIADAEARPDPKPPEPPSEFDAALAEAVNYFNEDPKIDAIIAAIKALAREVRR